MVNIPGDPVQKRTLSSLTPESTACTDQAGIVWSIDFVCADVQSRITRKMLTGTKQL
jgi:hypothetical protein